MRALVDVPMDSLVEVDERSLAELALGFVDLVEEELDLRPIRSGRPFGGKSCGASLERQPHLGKPCEILHVHPRYEHPAAWIHVDEPLAGERT